MFSTFVGMRAGRLAVAITTGSVLLASCRGDAVTGEIAQCFDQPGCVNISETVSPQVIGALQDAGTRLVGGLDATSAAALTNRLSQLQQALTRHDLVAGRMALVATYDVIAHAEESTPDARPDLGAIRLALIPAARALGLSNSPVSSVSR